MQEESGTDTMQCFLHFCNNEQLNYDYSTGLQRQTKR